MLFYEFDNKHLNLFEEVPYKSALCVVLCRSVGFLHIQIFPPNTFGSVIGYSCEITEGQAIASQGPCILMSILFILNSM